MFAYLILRVLALTSQPCFTFTNPCVLRFLDTYVQNMDEVQAYILLRRWYRRQLQSNAVHGDSTYLGEQQDVPLRDGRVSPEELRGVASFYFQERLCLLQSLEGLLWAGEGAAGEGPFANVVEDTLAELLSSSPDIEDAAVASLKANLERSADRAHAHGAVGGTPSMATTTSSAAAASAAVQDLQEEAAASERNVLMTILALIYFHPRKQCTPQRFLELARSLRQHVFSLPLPPPSSPSTPEQLSSRISALLLLEVLALDIDKLLEAIACGESLTSSVSPFLAPEIQRQLDSEISSWWSLPQGPHTPVILVWAALLSMAEMSAASSHAVAAADGGALRWLRQLSEPQGMHTAATEMSGTIVLSAVTAIFAAFGLDPQFLPMSDTDELVGILVGIFHDQPRLCESFWLEFDGVVNMPVRHFLDGLSGLFPAFPRPLLLALTAMSAGPAAASAANAYLAHVPALTCLHHLPDYSFVGDPNDSSRLITEHSVALPGAPALTLPEGVPGELLELPQGALIPRTKDTRAHLVRWRLSLREGTSQWVLLCRAFEAIKELRRDANDDVCGARGALNQNLAENRFIVLSDLEAMLAYLAAVCRADASSALELLHVEVPSAASSPDDTESPQQGGVRGPDILLLAAQVIAVLGDPASTSVTHPQHIMKLHCKAMAHAFRLMAAYVPLASGRVLNELRDAVGISQLAATTMLAPVGTEVRTPQGIPALRALVEMESSMGTYRATEGFLSLVQTLLQVVATPCASLTTLVSFVLHRVAMEVRRWKFACAADRWHLSAACISIVRYALQLSATPSATTLENVRESEGHSGGQVASSRGALSLFSLDEDGSSVASCLLPLLPPHASTVESMAQDRKLAAEIEGIEKCVIAWLRFVPVFLPPSGSLSTLHGPGSVLLRGCPPAATTLLSFLSYPFFGMRERALTVRALHCFAVVAAVVTPDVPLVAFLPRDGSSKQRPGIAPGARAALEQALSMSAADSCPELFGAACDVLMASIKGHASLLNALLFPSGLQGSSSRQSSAGGGGGVRSSGAEEDRQAKENKDGNAAVSTTPTPSGTRQDAKTSARSEAKQHAATSCLDALWCVVRRGNVLLVEHPFVLAKALQVLSMLWQAGDPAATAIETIQKREGFWKCVIDVVTAATKEGRRSLPLLTVEGEATASAWTESTDTTWRIAVEASALQLLATECFFWTAAAPAGSNASSMASPLQTFVREELPTSIPALLTRYCHVLPSVGLAQKARHSASAIGARLLAAALADPVHWATLGVPPSVMSALETSFRECIADCGSAAEASNVLASIAVDQWQNAADARYNGSMEAAAQEVLRLAEPPVRIIADREYGLHYVYDGQLLSRRIPVGILEHDDAFLKEAKASLAAVSVCFSLENACLEAASALDALTSMAEGWMNPQEDIARRALKVVLDTVCGFVAERDSAATTATAVAHYPVTGQRDADVDGASVQEMKFEEGEGFLANNAVLVQLKRLAAAAKTILPLLRASRRPKIVHAVRQPNDQRSALETCSTALRLCDVWLLQSDPRSSARSLVDHQARQASDTIGRCALASALHALSALAPLDARRVSASFTIAPDEENVEDQARFAAVRLLPSLLRVAAALPASKDSIAAITVATASIERLIPPGAWLPLLRQGPSVGSILAASIEALVSTTNHCSDGSTTLLSDAISSGGALSSTMAPSRGHPHQSGTPSLPQEALLLLALQIAQVPEGARILVEQGVAGRLVALTAWLLAPLPGGNLMGLGEVMDASNAPVAAIDYANAYVSSGAQAPTHRIWCVTLALAGLLAAALPGTAAVESMALQVAVSADLRLQLAVEPPLANVQQPLTLAMAHETKCALFLLCCVAKLSGQWLTMLPHALSAMRRASAALLRFLSHPTDDVTCVAVSHTERAMARVKGPAPLSEGWFAACSLAVDADMLQKSAPQPHERIHDGGDGFWPSSFAWEVSERLYACAEYALAFQLLTAPEVSEAEVGDLGPEWVDVATLRALQDHCLDVAMAADVKKGPAVRKLVRTVLAVVRASGDVLELLVPDEAARRTAAFWRDVERITNDLEAAE
jgi:hypothetical protein